jgi:hypothetical protein
LNIPIVPTAIPTFCPGAAALCPDGAMLLGVALLALVCSVVSTENKVVDRVDDPESKQVTLLEAPWLLILI